MTGLVQTPASFAAQSSTLRYWREIDMPSENQIDLEIALRKIHELALADGDLGYAYWYQVGQLLRRAASMQSEIDALSKDLEQCRAMLRMKD
jgi:hypothetical protein